jgi:twitching motility protein PilU
VTVKDLLSVMIKANASDLYLTVDSPPMFRVEGVTRAYGDVNLTSHQCEEIAMSLMSERQKAKFSETMEMNLGLYYPEIGRFRVNVYLQKGFVAVVFRRIRLEIETIDDLDLPPILKDIALTKRGLVLVVGGTGTGKSTTLAAMIEERNRITNGHIITIEDPIEFLYPHRKCIVSQREIGIDTLSYTEALKNAMRQAPDVILIGEIRDRETMESAVTFSETGHLCLSTLHANNANQAIERIMNFFPPEKHDQIYFQLSLNLRAVISQRLIPGLDGKRIAAVEILLDTPRVKDLIMKRRGELLKEAMTESTKEGMQTFDQHIFQFFTEGRISYENAIVYADSANDLRLRIKIDEVSTASATVRESQKGLNDTFRIQTDASRQK